jgi:hypothetical protein
LAVAHANANRGPSGKHVPGNGGMVNPDLNAW